MATGIYSMRTLQDNWVEDRLQPEGSLTVTGDLESRVPRRYETDLAYIGDRYDVLSRIARIPHKTSWAIPNDGFHEYGTTNGYLMTDPCRHPEFGGPSRPKKKGEDEWQPNADGAKRLWNTTHGDFYGEGSRIKPTRPCPAGLNPSGTTTEAEENRVTGMKCGLLCGENFLDSGDPPRDTRAQRSWIPGSDAALRNIHLGGVKQRVPDFDNHLSLPLGKGCMGKIREDLKNRKGRLCRIATCITKGAQSQTGMSLFQDD